MTQFSHPSDTIKEIERLARAGRKIEAIKLYREIFGVGLKEAKDAVENFERTGTWETAAPPLPESLANTFPDLAQAARIRQMGELLRAGKKIAAIKLYRVTTQPGD